MVAVTPHVGVWIETASQQTSLKKTFVTPHVGVWIETDVNKTFIGERYVTPYVGVWIETCIRIDNRTKDLSHPPRGGVD